MGAQTTLEDFGGGASVEKLTQATQGTEQVAFDIAQKEKEKADSLASMSMDNQLSQAQTQIQVEASKMKGQDALGAPDYVNKAWADQVQKIQGMATNDAQKMAVARAVSSRGQELNRFTQLHVNDQIQAFQDNQTQSYLENSRTAAVQNSGDPDKVAAEQQRTTAATMEFLDRKGIPSDSDQGKAMLQANLSTLNKSVLQSLLDKNSPTNAQDGRDFLEAHKDQFTAQDLITANKAVDQAETTHIGLQTWEQMKDWKLSDGTPDLARMQSSIYARDDLSDDRKVALNGFVNGLAKEAVREKYQQDAATERSFANDVIQARQQGEPLADALKLVPKYSKDSYDSSQKTAFIQKTYAPPEDSDPHVYNDIRQGIMQGTITKDTLETAFQKNQINTKDYRSLYEEYFSAQIEGKNPAEQQTWKRIDALADQNFGGNKQDKADYLYALHTESQGKTPDDVWKMANDKLKGTPGAGFLGIFSGPAQYKTDILKMDAQSTAWGKLHEDVGQDQVNAIGKGILYAGANTWSPKDVDTFAQQFGGYDNIKSGTPVNNAIQSLSKAGQIPTAQNVKTLLQKYPDGKYAGSFK